MAMESLSHRPKYDAHQYHSYLKYTGFLDKAGSVHHSVKNSSGKNTKKSTDQLRLLQDLQRFQLAKIPFENLSLHYSSHKTVDLDPNALYEKILGGRGGYCLENNCFFGTILRCAKFEVCSVGARVHEGNGIYTPWTHMVNIVTLADGKRYLVDVGFGKNVPTRPLLLDDGHEERSIKPATMRPVQEKIPATTNSCDCLWIYQHRIDDMSDWQTMYCFTETEFLPRDYEMMNFWTSQSRKSFFTYKIRCVRPIMDKETAELTGTLILINAELKMRSRGKIEQIKICKTERERAQVLEDVFDIKLAEEEQRGIKGMVTALPETDAEQ